MIESRFRIHFGCKESITIKAPSARAARRKFRKIHPSKEIIRTDDLDHKSVPEIIRGTLNENLTNHR